MQCVLVLNGTHRTLVVTFARTSPNADDSISSSISSTSTTVVKFVGFELASIGLKG